MIILVQTWSAVVVTTRNSISFWILGEKKNKTIKENIYEMLMIKIMSIFKK
jgi:hypothetical protein